MSTFYSGAGSKLAAGLQANYFNNSATTVNTKLNITSATFDPTVEKGSEETLLQSKVKNGSYLLSIGMEGSFDANLRPEMTDWTFKAATQNTETIDPTDSEAPAYISDTYDDLLTDYDVTVYTLKASGNDPLGSTFVLTKGDQVTTYPGMTVRSMSLNAPNNDFVTVSCDMVGREEIHNLHDSDTYALTGDTEFESNKWYFTRGGAGTAGDPYVYTLATVIPGTEVPEDTYYEQTQSVGTSNIPAGARPVTAYFGKTDTSVDYTLPSYIVTAGEFRWGTDVWCIEDASISLDNGIEDSPRCYQDGKYANIPVMGMRSLTLDFNLPYDNRIEDLKEDYLLTSEYGYIGLQFSTPEAEPESIIRISIPHLSITSVGAGISGTGIIEASVSGEAIQAESEEPILIGVCTKKHN